MSTPVRTGDAVARAPKSGRRPAALAVAGTVLVGLAVLVAGLLAGHGRPQPVPAGLPDPGALTGWGLPLALFARDLTGVGTVAALLAGGLLAPTASRALSPLGFRAVRSAAGWAAAWAVSAVAVLLLQMSDIVGQPLSELLSPRVVWSYVSTFSPGRAMLVVLVLAAVVAVGSRATLTTSGATLLLVLAVAAVLPPAFTGHSASAVNHDIAMSSLVVHVLAATLWVGGLAGLLLHLRGSGTALATAVPRYSSMALKCYVAVAGSGIVNAWTRLGAVHQLWSTRYGVLVLGKVVLVVALGVFGWRHRRSTVAAVVAQQPRAFVRLATGELLAMAAAFGLAVALSRSPTPLPRMRDLATLTPAEKLLGFDVPTMTAGRLLGDWRADSLVLAVAVLALWLYGSAVLRMHRRGLPWSPWRTASYASGVLLTVFVMTSGMATFAMARFSVHMAQHMVLTMLVPILLALGAPITLALRSLPAAASGQPRGAREWLLGALHSRPAQVVTHPVVALVVYITSLYGLYFSTLFETGMRTHGLHLLMSAHFLLAGMLFFWPILGIDPAPRRLPHVGRLLLLAVSLPFHAFFGVALLGGSRLIAEGWYRALALPGVHLVADQQLGGGLAWAAGELPSILVLVALLPQWSHADERAAKRSDRRADVDGDRALEAYNAQLAALAARTQRS